MITLKQSYQVLLIVVTLLFYLCSKNPVGYELIYYCSFESSDDTTGWQGITEQMFVDDPAPGCGKRSLHIGGGCLQPAAQRVLDSKVGAGRYRLSYWGKRGAGGGLVELTVVRNRERLAKVAIAIDSDEWKFYQAEGFLGGPPGCEIRLELWVGGYIYRSMFIDGLRVEKE